MHEDALLGEQRDVLRRAHEPREEDAVRRDVVTHAGARLLHGDQVPEHAAGVVVDVEDGDLQRAAAVLDVEQPVGLHAAVDVPLAGQPDAGHMVLHRAMPAPLEPVDASIVVLVFVVVVTSAGSISGGRRFGRLEEHMALVQKMVHSPTVLMYRAPSVCMLFYYAPDEISHDVGEGLAVFVVLANGGDLIIELLNDGEWDLVLKQEEVVDDGHVRPPTVRPPFSMGGGGHVVQCFHGDEQERGVMQKHTIEPEVQQYDIVALVSTSCCYLFQVMDPVQVVRQCLLPNMSRDHLLHVVQFRSAGESANLAHADRLLPLHLQEVVAAGVVGAEGNHHWIIRARVDAADTAMDLADQRAHLGVAAVACCCLIGRSSSRRLAANDHHHDMGVALAVAATFNFK